MDQLISAPSRIDQIVSVSGDKSISQRALILNSIATGTAHVSNLCVGDDRNSILRCLRGLGISIRRHSKCDISKSDECFEIEGRGYHGICEPSNVLNAGNSGTTLRLLSGLASGQSFLTILSGDKSLRSRPMTRILEPLVAMGAHITGRDNGTRAPIVIQGGNLSGIEFKMPIASAQVKSSVLIAGLFANGKTTVLQPSDSRDHTERMLQWMGVDLNVDGLQVSVRNSTPQSRNIAVPGDISSAAYWIVAGCIHPDARIRINGVGINPTRTGLIQVLDAMGANIRLVNVDKTSWEPTADIIAESSHLRSTEISGPMVPHLIDELPVIALLACMATGTTVIKDAAELRVKESDRIKTTVEGLCKLGAKIEERPDGMAITGTGKLIGNSAHSQGDHRIAMTLGIAGLVADGQTLVQGADAASISYPGFWKTLSSFSLN